MSLRIKEDRDRVVYETHTILDIAGYEDLGEDGRAYRLKAALHRHG